MSTSEQDPDFDENERLSAFDLPAAEAGPIEVKDVRLDEIEPLSNIRPAHHGIEGLAETMHTEGQLQPVVIRPSPATAEHDRPYELVFGYRRYLAAQSMNWETIEAAIRDIPDERKRRQLIIENFQREQLSPIAESRAMYELKYSSNPPLTNAEVARQLGCDPSQVSKRINMLIQLAPPRPESSPPPAHEIHKLIAPERDGNDDLEEGDDGSHEEMAASLNAASAGTLPDGDMEPSRVPLVIPGDPVKASEVQDYEPKEKGEEILDIYTLVDNGTISASAAEVIASLDKRSDQEQLTRLIIKQGWGVKKAAAWARGAKKADLEKASDSESLGPVEMLQIEDVTTLPKLRLRTDLTDMEVERLVLYMQLRNSMDQEVLNYISERLGYAYETLWDYISLMEDDQVLEFKRRMAIRYVTSAHRFFDIEPTLKDAYGLPDDAPVEDQRESIKAAALALPGADFSDAALAPALDELLALGPDKSAEGEDHA